MNMLIYYDKKMETWSALEDLLFAIKENRNNSY